MDGSPLWFTILAIVASVLSAGGIGSQIIRWRQERDLRKLANEKDMLAAGTDVEKVKITAEVDLKKVAVEAETAKQNDTARFQRTLLDRIELLEKRQDANRERVDELERANDVCEAANRDLGEKYAGLDRAAKALAFEHEMLKADHAQLAAHVDDMEKKNRELRARLARVARDGPPSGELDMNTGASHARRAVEITKE
jgi:chromosome segregation ATPase